MTTRWYLARHNREKFGPYSMAELKHLALSRRLLQEDMLRELDARTWIRVTSVVDVFPKLRALSIRQPFAELIMTGAKTIEHRSQMTHIRGQVYIYASKTCGDRNRYPVHGFSRAALPHGFLIGTVELMDCTKNGREFEWHLARPQRLAGPVSVIWKPQPVFFWPFGK